MNVLMRRMFSRPSRCIGCLCGRMVACSAEVSVGNTRTFYKVAGTGSGSSALAVSKSSNMISRTNHQRRWFCQRLTTKRRAGIPDELWVLVIVGIGGAAVFAFTIYKKKEIAIKKRSHIQLKLAEAKQCLDKGEKEAAYTLLKQALDMIHKDITEKQEKEEKNSKRPTHIALRFVLDKSANLASELQRWDEAEHLYRLTLQEFISSGLSTDDDAVIEVSLKLSKACEEQNKMNLAFEGYKWCVKTAEAKVNGLDEPTDNSKALLGVCLDGLGAFLLTHGYATEAVEVFTQSLEVAKEVLGPTDEQTLVIMNNLAEAYAECGKYEQAESLVRETIAMAEKTQSSFLATYLANLGAILMEEGKIKKGKKALVEALKLAEETKNEEAKNMIKNNMMKLDINV